MTENNFKSGFAAIIGMPNVGKSTLLNALVGQKIAIISDKPQTTRNRILAIRSTPQSQIIFVDTPGMHHPRTKLGEYMVNAASESARDADVVVMVTEAGREPLLGEEELVATLKKWDIPAILVINKIDTVRLDTVLPIIDRFSKMHDFNAIIPISAKKNDGTDTLLDKIEALLPEGPEFYPSDMVTDIKERELTAEIIREKLLMLLDKEVPHGIAIEVFSFEEDKVPLRIGANIYCEKDSHKGIIIGKGGAMLKKVGTLAREELEGIFEKKIFLELWVKVKPDWRNSNYYIKDFGYN